MVKADLIDSIAHKAKLTTKQAEAALNAFMKATSDALKKGDKVKLVLFGTFTVEKRKQRKGTHPRDGSEIIISARKVVRFKPSTALAPEGKSKHRKKPEN